MQLRRKKDRIPRIDFDRVIREAEQMLEDPKMLKRAQKAVQRQEAERKKMAKMTQKQLERYKKAWAKRLAKDLAKLTD